MLFEEEVYKWNINIETIDVILVKFKNLYGKNIEKRRYIHSLIDNTRSEHENMKSSSSYSYCSEYAVAVKSKAYKVGIDIEDICKIKKNCEAFKHFFSFDNHEVLASTEPTLIWTLHEAIGKLEGVGLIHPIGIHKKYLEESIQDINYTIEVYRIEYVISNHFNSVAVYTYRNNKYRLTIVYQ